MRVNKISKTIGLLIVLFSCCFSTKAQTNKIGNWFIYFGNQKINKRFNFHNEIQYRNYNFIGDINQLLIRSGIGYTLNNKDNILLGYGYIQSYTNESVLSNKKSTIENRIYQQYLTKHSIDKYFFLHRLRFEERFLKDSLQYRFRYFLSLNMPLNKEKMEKNAIYLSTYNEIFLKPTNDFFDRNRIYGGLGFVINKDARIETGYMIQTLKDKNQQQFQIILFNNTPFKN